MIKILIRSSKGGTGKSTLTEAIRQVLEADVIDMDHQKTLTMASQLTNSYTPISSENEATGKYLIYDTPPYNDEGLISLMENMDLIIIPSKIGYPDLLALHPTYEAVKKVKKIKNTILLFNDVRKPLTNEKKEIIDCFKETFPELKIAKTQLSRLDGFASIFRKPLEGKALEQTKFLLKEIL